MLCSKICLKKLLTNTALIGGMKCEHCAAKVAELLKKIPGIEKVVPSVAEGRIDIVSSVPVVKELVEKAVKEAGFDFKGFTEKK